MKQTQNELQARVRDELLAMIEQMNARHEAKLPAEKQLADRLMVSRSTVRTVLAQLEGEGKVIRSHGSGTYVNNHAFLVQTTLYPQVYYGELIQRSGYASSIQILGVQSMPARSARGVCEQLGLAPDEEVVEVSKIYKADGRMCIYCMDYLTTALAPSRLWDKLRQMEVSIFQFLAQHSDLRFSRDLITLTAGDSREVPEIGGYLRVPRGEVKPFLVIDTTNYDQHNQPVLFSRSYIDTDIIKYTLIRNNFDEEDSG